MQQDDFSISEASKQSGLSPRQIRYIERQGWIKPRYIKIGSIRQRRFSVHLVEQLSQIARLREEGFELGAAVAKVSKQ